MIPFVCPNLFIPTLSFLEGLVAYAKAAKGCGTYKRVNTSKVSVHFEICVLKTVFDFGMGSRVCR